MAGTGQNSASVTLEEQEINAEGAEGSREFGIELSKICVLCYPAP